MSVSVDSVATTSSRRRFRLATVLIPMAALTVGAAVAGLASRPSDSSPSVVAGRGTAGDVAQPSPDELASAPPDAEADLVVLVEQHSADDSVDSAWIDEATGGTRFIDQDPNGKVLSERVREISPAEGDNVHVTDYRIAHTDQQYVQADVPSTPAPFSEWGPGAQTRQRVASGELRKDGTEVVDGQELVRLVPTVVPIPCEDFPDGAEKDACFEYENSPHSASGTGVIWADPVTLRPVKELHAGGTPYEVTSYYSYFERDSEGVEAVTASVPESYTRVDQITPDGSVPAPNRAGDLTGGGS